MNTASSWIRRSLCVALVLGQLTGPTDALAGGKRGGHPGGGAKHPPRMSAAHRSNKAPAQHRATQASHPKTPARVNTNVARASVATRGNTGQTRVATNGQVRVNGNVKAARTAAVSGFSPSTYRYGPGTNARRYQAQGYGRGYRNRYSGGHSGYGRSQGNNRAVASRLRSVHAGLARLDHDYQGHRVRAMHHLSLAIRRLSHRSMSNGSSLGRGNNNLMAANANNRGIGGIGQNGANGRRVQHLTQAQADGRMSQSLRTTQGVAMQMSHQGTYSSANVRARADLQRAMHEMHTALVVH